MRCICVARAPPQRLSIPKARKAAISGVARTAQTALASPSSRMLTRAPNVVRRRWRDELSCRCCVRVCHVGCRVSAHAQDATVQPSPIGTRITPYAFSARTRRSALAPQCPPCQPISASSSKAVCADQLAPFSTNVGLLFDFPEVGRVTHTSRRHRSRPMHAARPVPDNIVATPGPPSPAAGSGSNPQQ
jgi:hypothetical protein